MEDLTDANLIRFLRGRKYDMERALETTVEMRRFKNENPDWFNPTPEALVVFDMFCGLLPTPSPHGHKVFVMFPAKGIKVGVVTRFHAFVVHCLNGHTPLFPPLSPLPPCQMFTDQFVKANPLAMIQFNIWMFDRVSRDPHVQVRLSTRT